MPDKPTINYLGHTVKQRFKKGKVGTLVGIEIEAESATAIDFGPKDQFVHWDLKGDGSLRRHGYEFVSVPVTLEEVPTALEEIAKPLSLCDPDCPRTSIHVHVNFGDKPLWAIFSLYVTVLLLQEAISKFGGRSRVGNNFALAPTQANGMHDYLVGLLKEEYFAPPKEHERYCLLNLASLIRFGTVEFRFMRGLTEVDSVKETVELCNTLVSYASVRNPKDIVEEAKSGVFLEFFQGVFPEGLVLEDDIFSNLSIAHEIVAAHPTLWDFSVPECDFRNDPAIQLWAARRGWNLYIDPKKETLRTMRQDLRYESKDQPVIKDDPLEFRVDPAGGLDFMNLLLRPGRIDPLQLQPAEMIIDGAEERPRR